MIVGKVWARHVVLTIMWRRWLFGAILPNQFYLGPLYVSFVGLARSKPQPLKEYKARKMEDKEDREVWFIREPQLDAESKQT